MDLCDTDIYKGCTMEASINLPFTAWSIPDGTYVNYTLVGEGDSCSAVHCKNDLSSKGHPGRCTFTYHPRIGRRIYAVGDAGLSAGFQATFNMEVTDCPNEELKPSEVEELVRRRKQKIEIVFPEVGKTTCPTNVLSTKRTVGLDSRGKVKTSPKTVDADKYFFSVCPDRGAYTKVEFSLQALDAQSAFATYFCPVGNCSTSKSPAGWFDDSGTALNEIVLYNLKSQYLWFNVYGWGEFHAKNRYRFAIAVSDQ